LFSADIDKIPVFVFDYNFALSNASLTEDYTISFAIDYLTSVNSKIDAFIDNHLILENPAEFSFLISHPIHFLVTKKWCEYR
jgi:hypothetical protein